MRRSHQQRTWSSRQEGTEMSTEIEAGAEQRPSGAWIPFTIANGKKTYYPQWIRKTKAGAINKAKSIRPWMLGG